MEFDVSMLLSIVGAITVVVSIITQVIKQVTWDKIPTNIIVLILSEALTLASGFAYAQYADIQVVWYMVVGAVVIGFFVAFAAMFGFDKLVETITNFKKLKKN